MKCRCPKDSEFGPGGGLIKGCAVHLIRAGQKRAAVRYGVARN